MVFFFRDLFWWCKFDFDNCPTFPGSSSDLEFRVDEKTYLNLLNNHIYLENDNIIDDYLLKQEAKKLSRNSTVMQCIDQGDEKSKKEKVRNFMRLSQSFANEMINGVKIEIVLGDGKAHKLHLSLNRELNALHLRRSGKKLVLPLNIVSSIETSTKNLISEAPELHNVDESELERIVAISTVTDDWYIFIMKNADMRDRFYRQMRLLVASIKITLVGNDRYWGNTFNGILLDSVQIEDDIDSIEIFGEEEQEF
ncbi:hypothetical protein FG386_000785 [Cryptosporidium ryanae]|uniref:uncharacterized protein n=1 Tax=Cryptosporidium ryanae TaxID=515981 RepID=UPI00351A3383|nr:hypothetical protein FG386_000785 [Cryptosporidium ryanae]